MEELINTLNKKFTGHGHYYVSIELEGETIGTTTTNMPAIDAGFDGCYDAGDIDNEDRYYENRQKAQESLINEILRKNNIEL